MTVSVKTYISNIVDVLAKVVLPSVDSAFARIQLSYAIDMLNQLQNRMEYRTDVIKDDYTAAKSMLDLVCTALTRNHIEVPEEIISNASPASFAQEPTPNLSEALTQVETALTQALDLMYEEKEKIKNFSDIEKQILGLSLQWVQRKGELKVPTINLELLESG
jgi:hypothetical protein